MKNINLLFLLMLSLMGFTQLRAQETLTVYDGTSTNQYVPMYGYYADTQGRLISMFRCTAIMLTLREQ